MEETVFEHETNIQLQIAVSAIKGKYGMQTQRMSSRRGYISFRSGGLGRSCRRMRSVAGDGASQAN